MALEAAQWGIVGAVVVELLQFSGDIRKAKRWPWRTRAQIAPLFTAVVMRIGGSAGLAALASDSGKITLNWHAGLIGMASPLIVEKVLILASGLLTRGGTDGAT